MKKDLCITKKYCAIGIMAVVLFVLFLLAALPVKVNAEANTGIISNETTYKELTDDDQLSGLDVTLDDYIDNMKSDYYIQTSGTGDTYQRIYEHTDHMSKIIPIDLFKEPNTTYYLGAEYFFYIHTYYDSVNMLTSSVMLLDYDYEYSDPAKSASIRLTMLPRNYAYLVEDGQDVICPLTGVNNHISVLNPQMFGVVNNKHSLNQYDEGYSKSQDPGIIFRQARLNYIGAYQEVNYSWEPVGKFVVGKVLGAVASWAKIDDIWDTITNAKDIIDALVSGVEVENCEVKADNENEITDYYTKAAQIENPNFDYLTKAIRIKPAQNTIINDYIELKVLLSEDIEPTELNMGAFFDVRIEDPMTGEVEILSFGENTGHVIFSQTIYEEIYDYDDVKDNLYVLPGDKQILQFNAPFYTDYIFTHDFSNIKIFDEYDITHFVGLNEVEANDSEFVLNNDILYFIELYNNSTSSIKGSITETVVADILTEGANNIQISPDHSSIYKLEGGESIVEVDTHNENVRVEFYDEEYNLMQFSNNGTEYIAAKDSGRIYVIFINYSGQDITANITYVSGQTISRGQNIQIAGTQERYYRFVPDLTADYIFETDSGNLQFSIKNESANTVYRLQAGKTYFIEVHNQSTQSAEFSINFDVTEMELGRNNLADKDIGVYKFVVPQDMRYSLTTQKQISYIYIDDVKQYIGATSVNDSFAANTIIYIVLNDISNADTITISVAHDDELVMGTQKVIQAGSDGYSIVKFTVEENSYYSITSSEEFTLYTQSLLSITNQDYGYLSVGVYYIKANLGASGSVTLKVEKVSQQINPHQHYTINETSYFVVDLEQNTEYLFETLGDADRDISTSIKIYNENGTILLTSGNFAQFGSITFDTGNNTRFNIVVGTDSNLTFVFRIVYASAADIHEALLSLNIGGYTTATNSTYLEFSTSSPVELYIDVPSDVASIQVYNVDGYTKLTPIETEDNSYKKYLFQTTSSNTYTLYIHADNAQFLPIVILPVNENNDIIIKDATGNVVNNLLNSNTYSFEWNNNGVIVPNTILSLDFLVNDVVKQPNGIVFSADNIGDTITVEFRLFDRIISEEFTLEKVFDLNLDFDVITDAAENGSDTDVNPTLHLALIPTEIDNGSDGTASISNKIIKLGNQEWELTDDTPIDFSNYVWENEFVFTVGLRLTDDSYYEKNVTINNNEILFNDYTAISSESKLVYLLGGETTIINKTIEIPSNVVMVSIAGNSAKTYDKLSFYIEERETPLLINIKNMKMYSYYDQRFGSPCFSANDRKAFPTVMRFEGNNYFYASTSYMNSGTFEFYRNSLYMIGNSTAELTARGANGEAVQEGRYGRSGSIAIAAESLVLQGFSKIYVYGGNGSKGGTGEKGEDAPDYTYIGYYGNLGEDGGNGANAIYCNYLTINVTNIYAYGGDGGQGGQGGVGGNGAHGWNNPNTNGGKGGDGSLGGKGGCGGSGGNGGDAVYVHRSASINVSNVKILIGGDAGKAGKGGTGGKGGDGGKGATGTSGIAGGKGGTGGNGGDGGQGGDGGRVGFAGYGLYISGQRSGTIGNSYNSTYYLNQAKGTGGAGGSGGDGGNGGDGWFGTTGDAGAKGQPGDSGSAGQPGFTS